MNKKQIIIGTVSSIGMLLTTLTPAFAASFSNGSFETPTATGPFQTITAPDSTTLTPWSITSGNIDLIGTYWNASKGSQSLDMNGTTNGAISQQFDTTPGYTYVVGFDMSGNPDGGPAVKTMDVNAGGTTSSYSYDTTALQNTKTNMKWQSHTFTFKANSSSSTLSFTSTTDPSSSFGPALDNVTVGVNPASFNNCSHNGYVNFVDANGKAFTNQGQCIAYVATHLHNTTGNVGYTAYTLARHGQWGIGNDGSSVFGAVGAFAYTDTNHDWYIVNAKDLNVSGNTAWFAGPVIAASQHAWIGNWLFAKVVDNGPDMIWGSFTTQSAAETGVAAMSNPADGPFNVTSGNLTVH